MLTKILHTLTLSTLNVVCSGNMDTVWKYKTQSTINTSVLGRNNKSYLCHYKLKSTSCVLVFKTKRNKNNVKDNFDCKMQTGVYHVTATV
jgi:hypothetical protein